ncbi:hypothetical protein Tco_0424522 [Tanacetum coccineum]
MTKTVLPDPNEPAKARPYRKRCSHTLTMNFFYGAQGLLNNMGCVEETKEMLEIKFYSTYAFDEVLADDELGTNKVSGLRSDENFNARDYWLSISSEEELHLSRSLASTIRCPILRVLQKMITYEFITRIAKRMGLLTDEVLNSLSAPTYCRALDATTLRELIGPNRRLITEDPAPEGTLERMAHRQLYHTDRYAGLFEHMAGHYGYTLQGAYAPPGYNEEHHDDEE